ncbi:MAG TPA: lipopolysaccharide biosynthesis protein [Cyanobacteria bacterium UBA11149]|nr:lipopolysaccharide biosynthesis protein [Cyanobacteria bacterium UBA11367]HBE60112.1 lipopolysaccharide biosynthesis protein [Cyanobacteria bacterium UBA11366]HBK62688.1 lipopolysaccharide biosynthesis protein [Cyanobacteria bacterium UBA11166]HBS71642.1 lipopolysaccharide biosynthesis protein [Cyanobacteria bacterium UBA11153]HBW90818.1 lipopolysaccharide biosynthesis protein [Cyanobacteria bacterium UBA11149]HCA97727.1 lipopolysaccharide biosynthesis protein [Cyanobacteria bacterium UBA92
MESTEYIEEIDFQKYWLVLKRRWLPAVGVFGGIVAVAGLAVIRQVPSYQAQGTILIQKDRSASLTGLDEALSQFDKLAQKSDPIATAAAIVKSRPIAEKTVAELNLRDETGNPIKPEVVLQGLQVKPVAGTDVMTLTYQSKKPDVAAAVVNKVMEVYIADDIQANRAKAAAAREFITEQLPRLKQNVSIADAELRNFKEQNKIVDLVNEAKSSVETVADLDTQIAQTQAKLAEATAQTETLRSQVGLNSKTAVAVNSLNQSAGVNQALAELQKVQSQLAVERGRFLEEAPIVQKLKEQETKLQTLVNQRIGENLGSEAEVATTNLQIGQTKQDLAAKLVAAEVEQSGLSRQLAVLTTARIAYKERSNSLPRLQEKEKELERRVEATQLTYSQLLQKLDETRLIENQNVGNARIVEAAAVPEKPTSSKKKLIAAGGVVVGGLLGIAVAFLVDLIDHSVKNVKEAKELFGYTLLGVVPAFGKLGNRGFSFKKSEAKDVRLVARDTPGSPIAQAYQMLRANLKFLSSDKQIKAIVVTSSVPQEGKSEVSANLAAAIAQVGRRVLLVDADMRHPSQHHLWNLTNAVGLSNLLVGEADFSTAVQEVMPGLEVLTSGVIPPNPVAILDSKRMANLMETFAKGYDAVIVDTPPMAGIADAPILGKMADGILLVVRPGVVDAGSAKAAKEFIARSGQTVLGIVANGVTIKNEPDSYFYYSKENYYTKKVDVNGVSVSLGGNSQN